MVIRRFIYTVEIPNFFNTLLRNYPFSPRSNVYKPEGLVTTCSTFNLRPPSSFPLFLPRNAQTRSGERGNLFAFSANSRANLREMEKRGARFERHARNQPLLVNSTLPLSLSEGESRAESVFPQHERGGGGENRREFSRANSRISFSPQPPLNGPPLVARETLAGNNALILACFLERG